MCFMCIRIIHLPKFGCNWWKTSSSYKFIESTGGALWSWLWFDIHNICCIISVLISPTRILSKMDVFPGMKFFKVISWIFSQYTENFICFYFCTSSVLVRWPCFTVLIGNLMCREHFDWARLMLRKHNVWSFWFIWYQLFLVLEFGRPRYIQICICIVFLFIKHFPYTTHVLKLIV